ncbi:M16 family metallopeptidase [Synechococcus sp. LTW-G]
MPRAAELIGAEAATVLAILPAEWGEPQVLNPLSGLNTAPLPEPQRGQLANGTSLVQLDLPNAPVVCLDFWCRSGSGVEAPGEAGIAHFLEHMVFKGSHSLQAGEFDQRIEALGGNSNAATGFDDVHYHVLIPPEACAEALELLTDLVLQPRLDRSDFDMERQVVLEELAQSEDQPEEVAFQQLLKQSCLDHAYGKAILGDRDALLGHTPEAMARFHARHYRADRCCLSVAGPLAALQLEEQLQRSALAQLLPSEADARPAPLQFMPGEERLELPRLEAARLLMAWPLPGAADQMSVVGGDLLTTLLAEGRRSRLVERLREQLRLVESVDLDLNVLESGCLVLLEAVCEPEHLSRVRAEINGVLKALEQEIPSEAEVERARRLVGNGYRFSLEAPSAVAAMVGNSALWDRKHNLQAPLDWLEEWDGQRLVQDVVPQLQPERAFVLEAVPA